MVTLEIDTYNEDTQLFQWFRFVAQNRYPEHSSAGAIGIDVTKTKFLRPFQLATLACLLEEYHQHGIPVRFLYKAKSKSGRHMLNVGLRTVFKDGGFKEKFLDHVKKNSLPVWRLQREYLDTFLSETELFYRNHNLQNKDLTPVRLGLSEALNNVLDHAGSQNGYVLSQYYPNAHTLVVVVCDFGVGIPTRVNEFRKNRNERTLTPAQCIKKALEKGFSTLSAPHNRGWGLDNILSNVNAVNGDLLIVSNKGFLWKQKTKWGVKDEVDNLEFSFPGTFIGIRLNANYFETIDSESGTEIDLF